MTRLAIVHVTTFLQGGAGRAITDLACAQKEGGHDVLVLASETGEGTYGNYPEYLDRLGASGVPLVLADSTFKRDPALNARALGQLREVRSAADVDVVHAHAAVPAVIGRQFGAAPSRRIPVVQTQHGWGISKTPAQAAHDLAVLHAVDRVVATSGATRAFLVECGVPAAHVDVVPCGVPASAVPGAMPACAGAIERLRAGRRRIVGCVGSVTANKNQQLLIDALAMTAPDVVAVIVGEGGETLRPHIDSRGLGGRVLVTGYQPGADRLIPLFDLLVVPSRTEGQGLVVLEAFREGVPVAASDIPALRELVVEGRTGWLFDPSRAEALAAAIGRALEEGEAERRAMCTMARARFDEGYTTDVMVARYEDLYRDVCREAGARAGRASKVLRE